MSDWWSYGLADFLMFSPQTWARLVARAQRDLWPLGLLGPLAGLAVAALTWRTGPRLLRAAAALLALSWLLVGWCFHWQRYAQVFLGAPWLAAAHGLQAALLLGTAAWPGALRACGRASRMRRGTGLALLLAGVVGWPLLAPASGRPWAEAETFALLPDPTALATLGWLLAAEGLAARRRLLLAVVPAVSLAIGLATRWTLAQ